MLTLFSTHLHNEVQPRLVAVGKYDGEHPCLTCATPGGKVFIHDPSGSLESQNNVKFLNINKQVTALLTGKLDDESKRDVLMIGTATDLLVYDVQENTDIFFKTLPDGAFSLISGPIGSDGTQLVFAGGSCSIQGYDRTGREAFWTVTGDNVCCLALADVDKGGANKLLVGSEGFDIRAFSSSGEMVLELNETEQVTCMCALDDHHFAFGLRNGFVCAFANRKRLWSVQMKHQAVSVVPFDFKGHGKDDLAIGWSDGRIEIRDGSNGSLLFREDLASAVAGLVKTRYDPREPEVLIACSVKGEVKGLVSSAAPVPRPKPKMHAPAVSADNLNTSSDDLDLEDIALISAEEQAQIARHAQQEKEAAEKRAAAARAALEEEQLKQLEQKKRDLTKQLEFLNEQQQHNQKARTAGTRDPNCHPDVIVQVDEEQGPHLRLGFDTESDDIVIRGAILFSDFFEQGCLVVHPRPINATRHLFVPLYVRKHQPAEIRVQLLLGTSISKQMLVCEHVVNIPRFVLFNHAPPETAAPASSYTFRLESALTGKALAWLRASFDELKGAQQFEGKLIELTTGLPLFISFQSGMVTIATDNVELAGDIMQSLATELQLSDCNSETDFPMELESLTDTLSKIEAYHAARQRMMAETCDYGSIIKALVVRAEDSRMLRDFGQVKQAFLQLSGHNKDLLRAYNIRCANHVELQTHLKQLNIHIQNAGRLRAGKAKAEVVNGCRAAIKDNDVNALLQIIRLGSAAPVLRK